MDIPIELLFSAHQKARKNKRHKNEIIRFEVKLAEYLFSLQRCLSSSKGMLRSSIILRDKKLLVRYHLEKIIQFTPQL